MIGITKESQLKHNKKPKISTFGKTKSFIKKKSVKNLATPHEKEYLEYLNNLDVQCYACGEQNGIEWHHIKAHSSDKKNHKQLVPLCGIECHRLGTHSAHSNPRWFREMFPIDEQREIANIYYKEFLNE